MVEVMRTEPADVELGLALTHVDEDVPARRMVSLLLLFFNHTGWLG